MQSVFKTLKVITGLHNWSFYLNYVNFFLLPYNLTTGHQNDWIKICDKRKQEKRIDQCKQMQILHLYDVYYLINVKEGIYMYSLKVEYSLVFVIIIW